jgi:hypothetical protein
MRQGNLGIFNLIYRPSLQLPAQLKGLAGSGGTERMSTAKQATIGIYGVFTTNINGA